MCVPYVSRGTGRGCGSWVTVGQGLLFSHVSKSTGWGHSCFSSPE